MIIQLPSVLGAAHDRRRTGRRQGYRRRASGRRLQTGRIALEDKSSVREWVAPGARVLELGCGCGVAGCYVAARDRASSSRPCACLPGSSGGLVPEHRRLCSSGATSTPPRRLPAFRQTVASPDADSTVVARGPRHNARRPARRGGGARRAGPVPRRVRLVPRRARTGRLRARRARRRRRGEGVLYEVLKRRLGLAQVGVCNQSRGGEGGNVA